MSTYEERQAYRDSHPGVVVDNSSSSDGGFHSDSPNGTPSGDGGGGGGAPSGGGGGGGGAPSGGGGAPSGSYQTKNGTQTVATMAQQLQNVGWGGNASDPASVVAAYASTTGAPVTPIASSSGGAGGAGGGGAAPPGGGTLTNPAANQALLTAAANQANQAYLMAKLQLDSDELAFRKAQDAFARTIQEAQLTGTFQGAPTLAAQQQQFSQGISAAGVTGFYNGNPTLARETQQQNTANQYLQLISGLRGPNDPFQYLRTLQSTPQGITDIVNAAAGRYMMGGNASGEISQAASLQGQLNNLNAATGTSPLSTSAGSASTAPAGGGTTAPAATQPTRGLAGVTDTGAAPPNTNPIGGDFGRGVGGAVNTGAAPVNTNPAGGDFGGAGLYHMATGDVGAFAGPDVGGQRVPGDEIGGRAFTGSAYTAPAAGQPGTMQMPNLTGLPLPNQINAFNYGRMNPSQQAALWAAYEYGGPTGAMRPADAQFAYLQSLPKYTFAPNTTGTVRL